MRPSAAHASSDLNTRKDGVRDLPVGLPDGVIRRFAVTVRPVVGGIHHIPSRASVIGVQHRRFGEIRQARTVLHPRRWLFEGAVTGNESRLGSPQWIAGYEVYYPAHCRRTIERGERPFYNLHPLHRTYWNETP
ncbi:MAG: hypothetical protein BWY06_02243 [Candidatus Latescibacteria bacterium ADurb.Bin168]|nr:MAG: hypothetical protein BWY06_02243 [Candidatus Latescibacteria bacterium ADurb.Bin168]